MWSSSAPTKTEVLSLLALLVQKYKYCMNVVIKRADKDGGTQFTCFTGTKVQILTLNI
jgi:hypothetical protein